MDADDLIDQDMYEVLIKNLDMTNSDVSACSYVKEYNLDRGKIIGLHKNNTRPDCLYREKCDI